MKIKINNTLEDISFAVQQVEVMLKEVHVKPEHRVKSVLTLEEVLVRIYELTKTSESQIQISIIKGLRKRYIQITYKGSELRMADLYPPTAQDKVLADEYGPEAEAVIRDMVIRANSERLNCRHSHGVNTITILVSKTEKALLYDTLFSIGVGLTIGLISRFILNPDMLSWVCGNLFMPLYSVFITVISMVIAPFIFFSLSTSIAGFKDMSSLGRTGAKMFGCYLTTTLIGILLCIGIFYVFQPGQGGGGMLPAASGAETETIVLSPIDKLLSIIPTSFVGSFAENDMLKIMFLAILIGICIGRVGKNSEKLKDSFNAFNDLFSQLTSLLSGLLPVAIFGSTANMAATLEVESVGLLASLSVYLTICVILQFGFYLVMLVVFGRLNPLPFIRKFSPAMITAFVTSSSSVTIPTSQECCRKMGISSRIYSFSIPLGANINMDGTSLLFCGTALFLSNLYGVVIEPSVLVSLVVTIMLISVALPGVPGAGTACLLMVFAIVGVPAEAFGLVLGLYPLLELMATSLNVAGDGAMATIVANSENALDKNDYNK